VKEASIVTKKTRTISLAVLSAGLLIVLIVVVRDVLLRQQSAFECGDGPRRTIDMRDFTTKYSGYSVELEANVQDKASLSTKVAPVQLQQLTEALQNAQEFRKFVVAGYNSCGITKAQYSEYGARFQALDALAREINQLTGSPIRSPEQDKSLASLIVQFSELARRSGAETGQQPTNKVQQSTSGAGSPAVQGVQGDVTITVDQSSGEAKPKNAAEKKPDRNK
jgi:hypothetical protein